MSRISHESYVTLATNDNYALGALTLAQSLKNVNTTRYLTIMITNEVSIALQNQIRSVFDYVEVVNIMNSMDSVNLNLLQRPDLGVTFTKLHCWRMVRFQKCVFLDADCLVLSNPDELFDREEFSAAADVGWPDCFNSGVFVYKPSIETYTNLLNHAVSRGSFDGGDQGLLNSYFSSWSTSEASRRLPFIYNMTTNVSYGYAPAFKQFKDGVKIVHFIGSQKPWYCTFNASNETVSGGNAGTQENEYLVQWWKTFTTSVYPMIDVNIKNRLSTQIVNQSCCQQGPSGGSGAPGGSWQGNNSGNNQQGGQASSGSSGQVGDGIIPGSNQHLNMWEQGKIEYTGRDAFSNIQAHMDSKLKKK